MGVRDPIDAANAGLDLEMPGVGPEAFFPSDVYESEFEGGETPLPDVADDAPVFGEPLESALEAGRVGVDTLDRKVERVLRLSTEVARGDADEPTADHRTDHAALATRVAVAGSVLLKNDEALPLEESRPWP